METCVEGKGFLGLKKPLCDLETAKVVVVPFGYGVMNQIVSSVPQQLVTASCRVSPYGDDLVTGNFFNIGVATWQKEFDNDTSDKGKSSKDENSELEKIVREVVSLNKIPIILGGDKTITITPVQVLNKRFGDFVVLSFDAHCNLEDLDGDRVSVRSTMRKCMQYAKQILLVGVRHISKCERDLIVREDKERIRCFRMRKKIRRTEGGIETLVRNLENWLKGESVYISFDPDVLSSEIIRDAVPYPEPGGFTYDEVLDIFERLLPKINVVGADFSGLAPKERNDIEVYMIAKLIGRFISNLKFAP